MLAVKASTEMGATRVRDPDRIVIPFDHIIWSNKETTSELHRKIRGWVRIQEIPNFFDIGDGICHQIVAERFARPGMLIVGADSHSCTYRAFGAFGTGIGFYLHDTTTFTGRFIDLFIISLNLFTVLVFIIESYFHDANPDTHYGWFW